MARRLTRGRAAGLRVRSASVGGRTGLPPLLSSDLGRAVETVEIAFEDSAVPVLKDWRLRECNYGALNGRPVAEIDAGEGAPHREAVSGR